MRVPPFRVQEPVVVACAMFVLAQAVGPGVAVLVVGVVLVANGVVADAAGCGVVSVTVLVVPHPANATAPTIRANRYMRTCPPFCIWFSYCLDYLAWIHRCCPVVSEE